MRWSLAAAMVLVTTATGDAFVPVAGERPFVVAGSRQPRLIRTVESRVALAGWRAIWDHDTGVPLRLWGGGVGAPGAVADPGVAERAARAFLVAHLSLLAPGAAASDFAVVANQLDGDVRTVGFHQSWRGIPVVGGQLGFVFAHDQLIAIGSEALPDVHAASARPHVADPTRAEAWILAATGHAAKTRAIGAPAILPIVYGPGAIEYRVVDVLDVEAIGVPGRWDVYVDDDGIPVARRSRIAMATGTLTYNVGVRYASGVRMDLPAPLATITVNGAATTTGADGSFAWTGSTSATVVPRLVGSYVRIDNQAGAPAIASLVAQPGQPVSWNAATTEYDDAQLSTYIYANIVKARARIINPAVAAWLDVPLDFYVNEAGTCNAYSTGNEVHFYRADATCENTGRVADVVFHEFGHSLHEHSIIPGMGAYDIAMSEGLADFNAANITEDSGVGRGFYLDNLPLRDIDPPGREQRWPENVDGDPHITGEIISGALWDLRKALVRAQGHDTGVAQTEKIFTGIMQRAADLPSTYMAALIADGAGTPDQCAIDHAFGIHGLVPGYQTTTVGSPIVDGLAISVPVTTVAEAGCPTTHVTSITVTWQVGDGVPSSFALVAAGDTWTGAFPPQPEGTVVTYSIDAELDDGESQARPNNPADPMYQLFVGTATPIWCELFDQDPHWAQTGVRGGEWDWGVPGGNPASGDPPAAHTGMDVYGTNVTGNGFYFPNDATSTETPAILVPSYDRVHLQYWRWLTIEDAKYDQAQVLVNGTPVWQNASDRTGTLDHLDREWRFHDDDITALVVGGGTAQVQWTLASDSSNQFGGWTLDDVCLVGLTKRAVCGDGALDEGEQCDDGPNNGTHGDPCSATCTYALTSGGGGCSTGGGAGWLVVALVALRPPRRTSRRARPSV